MDRDGKPFVFVLMPFSEEFADLYELGIRPACADAGAYCERVDEQIFLGSMRDRIYGQIAAADVIVAEMTGRNPNVFYETGYAHALRKQVILLTRDAADIPFDLKDYPHIVYGGRIAALKAQLAEKVRWCIRAPAPTLKVSADAFPWPQLLRRGLVILHAAREAVEALGPGPEPGAYAPLLAELAGRFGARRAHDVQVSVIDRNRRFLYHDHEPFIGGTAQHVGDDGHNIYDEVERHPHGAFAWVDHISNLHRSTAARLNVAVFTSAGEPAVKIVVETHREILGPHDLQRGFHPEP